MHADGELSIARSAFSIRRGNSFLRSHRGGGRSPNLMSFFPARRGRASVGRDNIISLVCADFWLSLSTCFIRSTDKKISFVGLFRFHLFRRRSRFAPSLHVIVFAPCLFRSAPVAAMAGEKNYLVHARSGRSLRPSTRTFV